MKALMFTVYGKYGYFKNHEANSINMTYQFIHKPCIIGLLGAMIGLDGWRQMKYHDGKLEYYEVFKNSKISIIPTSPYYDTFYETINNCTGFVNKGGATANIKRQILQNPSYTLIIQKDGIDEEYYNKLKEMLFKGESIYRLCLGNNNYTANIKDIKEITVEEYIKKDDVIINSLIKDCEIEEIYEESEDNIEVEGFQTHMWLPTNYNINGDYGHYKEQITYNNFYMRIKDNCKLYSFDDKVYYFM